MTIAQYTLHALIWLLLGLGLALGVIVGRLNAGPVALDWLKPRVEQALTPGNSDIRATVGKTELRLDESRRTIELVGLDVRYHADDGDPFLAFPEVNVGLSVEAFLNHGLIAASHVRATAPSLRLTRNDDGVIGLYSINDAADEPLSDIDFIDFLRHVVLAPKSDDRIAFLKHLQISGGRVIYDDQAHGTRLHAEQADLVLTRQPEGVNGWIKGNLMQAGGPAALQLLGRVDAKAESADLSLDADSLIIADLAAFLDSIIPGLPKELSDLRSPVTASMSGSLGFDGRVSPIDVTLQMKDGVFDLPDHLAQPLEVTLGHFDGVVSPDFDQVDVNQMRLLSRGAELQVKGRASWPNGEPSLDLDLMATDVRAQDLPGFWPPELGAKGREWVIENIKTGRVPRAEARLQLRPEDFGPAPLRHKAVSGHFAFEGLSVRYIDTMPPIENGLGKASFDADRLHFDVESGDNAGVALTGGTVTITGLGKPGKNATQLTVLAGVRGPVDRALALLDHPPLDLAKDLEIAPPGTSGSFSADLDVRMPLYDDVTDEEVDVLAEARLDTLGIGALPKLGPDIPLEAGIFDLSVGLDAVRLEGAARVGDLPLEIMIEEPLTEGTAKRRIVVKGELTETWLERLDQAVEGLTGNIAFEATVTETEENFWVDLDADLTNISLVRPEIRWRKTAGEEGRLRASIAVPNEGPIDVKQFDIGMTGLEASGSLIIAQPPYHVSSLNLDHVQIDDSQGALRLKWSDGAVREVVIQAGMLDLDRLFAADDEQKLELDFERLRLVMRADTLIAKGLEFRNVQADASYQDETWRTASFFGSLQSGQKLALELVPDGDLQRLDIRSDDAGALVDALGLGRPIDGGALHLQATLASQDPISGEGRLEISRFKLTEAPMLARLLTVASLTGIVNLLEGEGIQIDNLLLPFTAEDRVITLSDGLMRGSQLGLTTKGTVDLATGRIDLAGTIVPVYSLNRLIGQVPIIGRILTGSESPGAFAATYRLSGPRKEPSVYVNPLSFLTPGLIRDVFGGLGDSGQDEAGRSSSGN